MDSLAAIKVTFFQECEEQLSELEAGLLAMKAGDVDLETVNAVFRAVHSIKGGAGAFSLNDLVGFAHSFETVLDEMRSGRFQADGRTLDVMLRAADVLADLVRAARDGEPSDLVHAQALQVELEALITGNGGAAAAEAPDDFAAMSFEPILVPVGFEEEPAPVAAGGHVVTFKPYAALYAKANEPAVLLRELASLGTVDVTLDTSELPLLDELDPEKAYIGWTVAVATTDEDGIREVFDFVDGDCDLTIVSTGRAQPEPEAEPQPEAASGLPEMPDIQALIAMATGASMTPAPAPSPPPKAAAPQPIAPPKPVLVEPLPSNVEPIRPAVALPAPPPAAEASMRSGEGGGAAAASPTIRVDLERVDRLIDLVGELVINQAMLAQRVLENGLARSSGIAVGLDDLELLTREIQDSVMAIRAQPVKSVFQRMPRLVRELATATGKDVRLVMTGEETEVDKTVIERLTDPITHMIRNAIDHGLESTEKRVAAGKSATGTVRLAALHRSGRIVIEVADDGGGIDRKRVRSIAIEKGLISAEANLTDDEIDNIIFMPGFSTAATVSNISGRGVGMDVVRRSIQALGGRITITSRPGLGSTFTLSLPLTLAVLDGMVVSVCNQTFVLPITTVMETLQPKDGELRHLEGSAPLLLIRDQFVPLVDVGNRLGYRDGICDPTTSVALLVEGEDGRSAALVVDTILGQRQVVIKSLEANYRRVPGIAAATILGDGRVALILDVDAVIASYTPPVASVEAPLLATG